jgi:2-keto-3-deoxy-L-fuconate dehydrogenase
MNERTMVVTGGGSGIGRAIVERLVSDGFRVHVIEANSAACNSLEVEYPEQVVAHLCDVTNADQVAAAIDAIPGVVCGLVNNAGIAHVGALEETNEADLDRLYSVNVKGVFHASKAILPKLRENGGGVILNMASVAATVGIADRLAYSMTKGAVLAMTRSIARDYIKDGIRCNAISPARVHTPFVDGFLAQNYPGQEREKFEELAASQPIGRMGKPEEIAALVSYLCSEEASFITGSDFPIDGGFVGLKI